MRKITLAHFKVENEKIARLPRTAPYWPQVDKHILTVNDVGQIYVLNLWNNEILSFDGEGKLRKKIGLQFKFTRSDYQNGYLEVSGDGNKIFVYGDDKAGKSAQFIFDQDGKIIKRFSENEIVWNFPDRRLCNDQLYMFTKGSILYDKNFKETQEPFFGFVNNEGEYKIDLQNRKLIKNAKNGKTLWEKQFDGYFGIIGIDQNHYMYIEGKVKKGDPNSIYKLNSKGDIVAQAPIPDPFPFLTKEEKEEWEMHSSDEYFSFWKLACNGDVYLIYDLSQLPSLTFKRWLKGGEYFIYKFEMAEK